MSTGTQTKSQERRSMTPAKEQQVSEAKHTQEQWESQGDTVYAVNERGLNIFSANVQRHNSEGRTASAEEIAANVRLMAAAPCLLDSLQRLVQAVEYTNALMGPAGREIISSASVAIALAEGRPS